METAGGGAGLALVLAAQFRRTVEALGWLGEAQERDLSDFHAVIQGNGQASDVAELQRQAAAPAGIHEAGGAVDQQPDASQAALAFQAGNEVIGQLDVLQGAAQDELPGVQDELIVALDFDLFGQVGLGLPHVDVRAAGV